MLRVDFYYQIQKPISLYINTDYGVYTIIIRYYIFTYFRPSTIGRRPVPAKTKRHSGYFNKPEKYFYLNLAYGELNLVDFLT